MSAMVWVCLAAAAPKLVKARVNQEIEKLKKGDIKVPKDKKEYDTMMK